jgi:hypothetical protein
MAQCRCHDALSIDSLMCQIDSTATHAEEDVAAYRLEQEMLHYLPTRYHSNTPFMRLLLH